MDKKSPEYNQLSAQVEELGIKIGNYTGILSYVTSESAFTEKEKNNLTSIFKQRYRMQ